MVYEVNNSNIDVYTDYINRSGNIFQRVEWLKSNKINDYFTFYIKNDRGICIAGTYIFINVDNKKCIYFPRGPVIESICTLKDIEECINYLKDIGVKNNCNKIYLDFKYNILSLKNGKEIENNILKFTNKTSFSKFWHLNWGIDLNNITIEEYLKSLKEKTRYNINYAIKNGVKILTDNSSDSISKFYKLLKITADRDKFRIKDFECYENLFKYFKESIQLFWAYKDNTLLSAAIYIIIGDVAYYLYGASSNEYRNYKPTYLMHYKMIEYSINNNCKMYNLGGVGTIKNNSSYAYEVEI